MVLPYIDMNHHRYTCVPHPEPPSLLPPHPIPLGHPCAPAPSILYHALNLDWRFVSHMIIYMFQCHSPKSSHPRPLPQSPEDCSIPCCFYITASLFKEHSVVSVRKFRLAGNLGNDNKKGENKSFREKQYGKLQKWLHRNR